MTTRDPAFEHESYQGVPLRRLVAFCVDVVIVFVISAAVMLIGVVFTFLTLGLGAPLAVLAVSLADFLYRWLLLAEGSATLGMRLVGIQIRDCEGRRLDALLALLHVAGFYVSIIFAPLLIISWVVMAFTPERRMLHDLVLGTLAVNRRH